jgi:hypothetical protein
MLRACALKHGGSWDKSFPYAEFSLKVLINMPINLSSKVI